MARLLGTTSSSPLKLALVASLALHYAFSDPGRLALCLLATSAANFLLGVQAEPRSSYKGRSHTAYTLLIRAVRSLEIACYLVQITTLLGMPVLALWLFLFGTRALYLYAQLWYAPYFLFRQYLGDPLLQDANTTVEVVWVMQVVWTFMPKGGFWAAARWGAPLIGILIVLALLYEPMCRLQNRISDHRIRRARGTDGNARNAATCLPAEVQMLIFELLRTRGRFGAAENLPRDSRLWCDSLSRPFSGGGDLAAAARVCTAWRGPATKSLYRDAILRSAKYTCRFSLTLKMRPELALLVRRIVLPDSDRYEPSDPERASDQPWPEFSAAIEYIVSSCVEATDLHLFRDNTSSLGAIPGLSAAPTHLSHLAIHSGPGFYHWEGDFKPEPVDLLVLLGMLPRLTCLTLTRQQLLFDCTSLQDTHLRALGGIQELYLGACTMDVLHLAFLLRKLSNLRIAGLRDPEFSGAQRRFAVWELFATQGNTLADMRIHLCDSLPDSKQRIVRALSFDGFVALRSLTVNARMLPELVCLPDGLEELVVSFAPYSCGDGSAAPPTCRKALLDAVHAVRALADTAPALRAVQLWDDVRRAQLGIWAVAAFMLRAMLAPAGVAVAVNLYITFIDTIGLKEKFSRQKALRRIMWTDVF